jgi:hypothetical protein
VEKRGFLHWIKLDVCKAFCNWYANLRGVYMFSNYDDVIDFINSLNWHTVICAAEISGAPCKLRTTAKVRKPKRPAHV